ncbi:MAG: YceD family protein [Hyphomicrobiaceae bacterium]
MDEPDELGWTHKIAGLQQRRAFEKRANAAQRDLVSRIFADAQCLALNATYSIDPLAPGKYRVWGAVGAQVEQICGVTLKPIVQVIDEAFDVEFRAGARRDSELEPDFDALGDDDPEPIEQGEIRIGRFICEIVASAIDPFPRADDAALDRSEAADAQSQANPFAVLAQLKDDEKPN